MPPAFDPSADADLAALPPPPRRGRALALGLLGATGLAAACVAVGVADEARYALGPATPRDLGALAQAPADPRANGGFVRGFGRLSERGAVRYGRPFEQDTFRVAAVEGSPRLWVEVRLPGGIEPPGWLPPTTFVGRLVPLAHAGLSHRGLAEAVRAASGAAVPEGAALLVDGATPAASRWALGLEAVLAAIVGWCAFELVRLSRRVRD